MKNFFCSLLAAAISASVFATAAAQSAPLYHLAATIPLGGATKWDYLHFDPASNRVYISHYSELTVLDAKTGAIIGHVTGLHGSHGIAIDTAKGVGFADSGITQTISIFDLKNFETIKTIPALLDADGMVFDPASNQVFTVGGDAHAVLATDAATYQRKAEIPLGGAPESEIADGAGNLYININSTSQLVRIDTKTDAITGRWNLPGCVRPVGLAVDPATHVVFSSCANATMVVINGETGAELAKFPIGKGTDSAAFDPARKLAFSSNRDGTLSIIRENSAVSFTLLPPVTTEPGARTLAVDPASGDVFLVTAKLLSAGPPKHPGWAKNYKFVPGSVKALIYAP